MCCFAACRCWFLFYLIWWWSCWWWSCWWWSCWWWSWCPWIIMRMSMLSDESSAADIAAVVTGEGWHCVDTSGCCSCACRECASRCYVSSRPWWRFPANMRSNVRLHLMFQSSSSHNCRIFEFKRLLEESIAVLLMKARIAYIEVLIFMFFNY